MRGSRSPIGGDRRSGRAAEIAKRTPLTVLTDRFGNAIDPGVAYARGRIRAGEVDETLRQRQDDREAARRIDTGWGVKASGAERR